MGNLPSDLRYSRGLAANITAITRHTVMMKSVSVVRMSPAVKAVMTIIARKPIVAKIQMKFSSPSSLLISNQCLALPAGFFFSPISS
jgi:hypothetical protein